MSASPRPAGSDVRTASSMLCGFIALLILVGYAIGYEPAWRLRPEFPGTHPYTAVCLLLLSAGLLLSQPDRGRRWARLGRCAVAGGLTLLMIRLAVPIVGSHLFDALSPFGRTLAAQAASGKAVEIGLGATCAMLLVGVGEALRWLRRPMLSQVLAAAALGILFMVITGYLAGLPAFRSTMAPLTLLGIASLAVSLLFASERHGFMRALTANSQPGRLARVLLASSTGFLLVLGWLVAHRIDNPGTELPADGALLVYQTAAIIALTWLIVTLVTMRADRLDRHRHLAERRQERAATRDALTGLLTRNMMTRLRSGDRDNRSPAASVFIDLDRFRSVNEAFGPDQGDRVLVEVARRLRAVAQRHPVARIGGDEFAMYCVNVTVDQAERIGWETTAALEVAFEIRGRSFRLTASVGVAHSESAGKTDLRQAADDAMYVAKSSGGNCSVVFAQTMHVARKQEVVLEQDLYEALRLDTQLTLVYQPVIRVTDHALIALEALARWTHPRLGPIPLDRFIGLAEIAGLMVPLGLKLMEMAVRQAAAWKAELPNGCPTLNLNVSPGQLAKSDLVGDLMALLRRYGLSADCFCIEVTEGAFTSEPAVRALELARRLGFKVAMDDFGVGYSTLAQLPRLPITSVKLDKSFIVHATESAGDAAIFEAITQIAHTLKLTVIAEGVENQTQFDFLAASGCDAVQGYLFARPMRPEALKDWLLHERRSSVTDADSFPGPALNTSPSQ